MTFVGDFETTVYEGQERTDVWASGICNISDLSCVVHNTIGKTFSYLENVGEDVIIYYHNLRFDGEFYVSYLLNELKYKYYEGDRKKKKTFKCVISDAGLWFNITITTPKNIISIRDSLKLIPLSIEDMGKAFNTVHRKSTIEYKGFRNAGGVITEREEHYLKNDLLVLAESLQHMFAVTTKTTISSAALSEFKKTFYGRDYREWFPNLEAVETPDYFDEKNADEFIRKSYKGGWCYVNPKIQGREVGKGKTFDVNSLYPSVMHSSSGCVYPVGKPFFFKGDIPAKVKNSSMYYFIRIKVKFKLKDGYLPTVASGGSMRYGGVKWLTSSDYRYKGGDIDTVEVDGVEEPVYFECVMTMTDYELFHKHYNVIYEEVLYGCYFYAKDGIFDEYVDKWVGEKIKYNGGRRTIAKLFLNSLYGKMAANGRRDHKIPRLDDGVVKYDVVKGEDKEPEYIAIGSAITAYARKFTITHAQDNYDLFCYSDTDSCHLLEGEYKNIEVDDKKLLHWKIEADWVKAIFVRPKCYIEVGDKLEIKCAGLNERGKELMKMSLTGDIQEPLSDEEREFVNVKRNLTDFKVGLEIPGKLAPKRIRGGVILSDTAYKIRAV